MYVLAVRAVPKRGMREQMFTRGMQAASAASGGCRCYLEHNYVAHTEVMSSVCEIDEIIQPVRLSCLGSNMFPCQTSS